MSLSIPTTPEDLSPKWLTQALRSSPEEVQGWYQQWWPAFVAKVSHRLPAGVIAIGEQMLHRVAHLIEVLNAPPLTLTASACSADCPWG